MSDNDQSIPLPCNPSLLDPENSEQELIDAVRRIQIDGDHQGKDRTKEVIRFVSSWVRKADAEQLKASGGELRKALAVVAFLRPEVVAFAVAMEEKLRENDFKSHWSGMGTKAVLDRLDEEREELVDEIYNSKATKESIRREAADVGNIAMFAADNFGDLKDVLSKHL